MQRKSFVVVSFKYLQKVDSQDLKNHAKMIAVRPLVEERVEQVEDVSVIPFEVFFVGFVFFEGLNPLGMCSILCNFLQKMFGSTYPENRAIFL